jgi:putative hemolysin
MSEIAVVSSRRTRMEELGKKGNRSAKSVIKLIDNPNRFLSTIQVGITSIGILLGIFSGKDISDSLASVFLQIGISHPHNYNLAIAITVIIITYLTIVIGELVPKRIGMTAPETISLLIVRPMVFLSRIASPFVWLLSKSTDFLVKFLNIRKQEESLVTENEIKAMIEEGTNTGEIQEIEQDIVERVFHLGDQQIGALMTSRNDIIWLDINDSIEINKTKIASVSHSIYPLCKDDLDHVEGIIYVKDLFNAMLKEPETDLKRFVQPVNMLPSTQKAYQVLEKFKQSKIHFGIIVDEFGTTQGIVTINDILDALVGDITETDEPEIIQRTADTWLLDGKLAFFEFLHEFEIENFDYSKENFNSIGGFVIHELRTIPKTGDKFQWNNFIFEIVDMDGHRVDKILLTKLEPEV